MVQWLPSRGPVPVSGTNSFFWIHSFDQRRERLPRISLSSSHSCGFVRVFGSFVSNLLLALVQGSKQVLGARIIEVYYA